MYDPSSVDRSAPRLRATTIGNGHALRLGNVNVAALAARAKKKQAAAGNKKLIPTVFRCASSMIGFPVFTRRCSGRPISYQTSSSATNFSLNRFTGTTISKGSRDAKVFIAGTMTKWRAVEMTRQVQIHT